MGAGVYWIRNRTTGKVYIGSSVDIASRIDDHIRLLTANKHHSLKLQSSWNKHGADAFDFDVVDVISFASLLRTAEARYIAKYDSYVNGYNGTTMTGDGTSIPQEVRDKMSESAKRAGQNPSLRLTRSERAKAQHAAGKLGQATWKPGTSKLVGAKLKGRSRPDVSKYMRGNTHAVKRRKEQL